MYSWTAGSCLRLIIARQKVLTACECFESVLLLLLLLLLSFTAVNAAARTGCYLLCRPTV
jgi:hypothetical protein